MKRDTSIDARGRFRPDVRFIQPSGMMTRPMQDVRYDVNPVSPWAASSTAYEGQWKRGSYLFGMAPAFCPPNLPLMYDPTDPQTWGKPRA